jgi:hypothetical protein
LQLKAVRINPSAELVDQLRDGVGTARDFLCEFCKSLDSDSFNLVKAIKVGEGLGVLGGITTIVVNGITAAVAPINLTSIIVGLACSLTFLNKRTGI